MKWQEKRVVNEVKSKIKNTLKHLEKVGWE